MPLYVTGSNGPIFRPGNPSADRVGRLGDLQIGPECLQVALVNNMPDSALEDTELQFSNLLDAAAGTMPVQLKLVSLASVPRSDRGLHRMQSCYFTAEELWNDHFDAVIVTGTEPRQPDLRSEPYWGDLAEVFDWAERNTHSTILSCLAAHASVLHSDGILRHPLSDKQFGVFEFANVPNHPLTAGSAKVVRFPHSRWNEVRADALASCGYAVLTQSVDGGVDSFVKKKNKSLFVYFQGHPEYAALTLLREYRRDVRRFFRKERETYPDLPQGYFDAMATRLMTGFREKYSRASGEEVMSEFPEAAASQSIENTWQPSAHNVYRNWLQYLLDTKSASAAFIPPSTKETRPRKHQTSSM